MNLRLAVLLLAVAVQPTAGGADIDQTTPNGDQKSSTPSCHELSWHRVEAARLRNAGVGQPEAARRLVEKFKLDQVEAEQAVAWSFHNPALDADDTAAVFTMDCYIRSQGNRASRPSNHHCEQDALGNLMNCYVMHDAAPSTREQLQAKLDRRAAAYNAHDPKALAEALWAHETAVGPSGIKVDAEGIITGARQEWAAIQNAKISYRVMELRKGHHITTAMWFRDLTGQVTDRTGARNYSIRRQEYARFDGEDAVASINRPIYVVQHMTDDQWDWRSAPPATDEESKVRAAIVHDAQEKFAREDWAGLDAMAKAFRLNESRTPSGVWKLSVFYAGLAKLNPSPSADLEEREHGYAAFDKALQRWMQHNPESSVPVIAHAEMLIEHAYAKRGKARAALLSQEALRAFGDGLAEAHRWLDVHKSIGAQDPEWYRSMLTVAGYEGWPRDDLMRFANEAMDKFPRFYQIYFSALAYFDPRWYGSDALMDAFVRSVVERTRGAEGQGMYARMYWFAASSIYHPSELVRYNIVWADMERGIDDLLARYPDQWNVNHLARLACMSGQRGKTKELLAKIVGPPVVAAWYYPDHSYSECQVFAQGE